MNNPDPEFRIATVNATGQRYIVQRLYLPLTGEKKCFCWGEVTSYRGLASKHGISKTFLLSAVTVAPAVKTTALLESLFSQNIEGLRKEGWVLQRTRGGNYKVVSRPVKSVPPPPEVSP